MKKIVSLIYCMALLVFSAQAASACSCLEAKPDKKGAAVNYKRWLKNFDGAVFTGRVVKVEKIEADNQLKGIIHFTKVVNQDYYTPKESGHHARLPNWRLI